jgi:O-antigen/teichoic acid export membrane protein
VTVHIFPTSRFRDYIARDFAWALSGNVVYSVCQWGFVIVLAKLGTPEDVGTYAFGLAVTSPILMFANFQGRNLVASDVRNEYSFGDYLGFRIASLTIAVALVCAVALFTQSSWLARSVMILVGLGQSFDYGSELYFGLMQKHDRLDRVARSLMLKGPLCLLLLTFAMLLTHNVLWAVAALAVGRGCILLWFDSRNARAIAGIHRMAWRYATQAKLLITALPLGIISGMAALNLNIPRYFIESDLSKRDLGIFSAVSSLVGAGNLIMAALASCSIVALAKAWVSRDIPRYQALSLRLFGASALVGGVGVVVASVAGDKILTMLFRPEYAGSVGVFARIMLAGAVGYVVSSQGYAMTAARQLVLQVPLLIGTAIVTMACSWWLVPLHGLAGAAEAWLLGSLFQLVFSSILMGRMSRMAAAPTALQSPAGTAQLDADGIL